ncbi:uncharacterized protein [Emydura macquarii macquarii]|uniref:uncharacterized protein n=1 Tax=Emydura macquarii macquarii TaxID=1129001 RepID=UPI00352A722F
MAPQAKLVLIFFWLLSLCSLALAGVHRFFRYQLIAPQAAPGLPKRLNVMSMNDLVLTAYDSGTGRVAARNGYTPDDHQFWRMSTADCINWDSWVENEYQTLLREVNTSSPKVVPYYLQILHSCELDDGTGAARATTRYSLNGEDVLQYQADQNRWFSVHLDAWRVAERWNRQGEAFTAMTVITPQNCRFLIGLRAPFTAQKTGDSSAGAPHSRPAVPTVPRPVIHDPFSPSPQPSPQRMWPSSQGPRTCRPASSAT